MSGVLIRPTIILLLLSVQAAGASQSDASASTGPPPMSKLWTDSEKIEFQGCESRLASSAKEKTPQVDAGLCEVWVEHQHWMRAHPEASQRKENHAKFHTCNREHAALINGAPEAARAALDLCWCQAYGLPSR
jgi:hypothetical protein